MEEIARLLLLILVAAVLINLLAGGPTQVRAWAAAKFLGRA
jgi:hypothetical protein